MSSVKEAFSSLTPTDLAFALVTHEFLGITYGVGMTILCYTLRPSHFIAHSALGLRVVQQFPKLTTRWNRESEKIHNSKFLQGYYRMIPQIMKSVDPPRLAVALGESVVIRRILSPISVPAKLVATFYVISWQKKLFSQDESQH